MLAHWPIRYKLLVSAGMLLAMGTLMALSGFRGVYSYRHLARSISHRAAELPKIGELAHHIDGMRFIVSQGLILPYLPGMVGFESLPLEFQHHLNEARGALDTYKKLVTTFEDDDDRIGDRQSEQEMLGAIEATLTKIALTDSNSEWNLRRQAHLEALSPDVERLRESTTRLQAEMYTRMRDLQGDVRLEYRALIVIGWVSTIAVAVILGVLVFYLNAWIFHPLRVLVDGSRRVAAGDFAFRISLDTQDEIAELARAMNAMTERFVLIRDDLNRQVRERTKEVVRSEQLASVGFLAAGVAHEINNPLASIAWSAEGLESRLEELFDDEGPQAEQLAVARRYLKRIQDEAFRCKGITEGLLDFSRLGHAERQATDLKQIVEGVIEMVQHLGAYKNKHIEFRGDSGVVAAANPQEMKQVVLNLLTNALDSLDTGGRVQLSVTVQGKRAVLTVQDNGCGMTDEVREHLFEPFFTRRRDGQGTGLGLSITYRIVQDHGGTIAAHSEGPGRGSRFEVTLPLVQHETKLERRYQTA